MLWLLNVFPEFFLFFLNICKILSKWIKNELVTKCEMQNCAVFSTLFSCWPILLSSWVSFIDHLKTQVNASKRTCAWSGRGWWGWGVLHGCLSSLWDSREYGFFFRKGTMFEICTPFGRLDFLMKWIECNHVCLFSLPQQLPCLWLF